MDPIGILERKIAALELKVLPLENISEENMSQSVTDMLLQINTLISSALSCREVVTAISNRMDELNTYLDPNIYGQSLDTDAKKQLMISIYPEIRKYAESIKKMKTLVPVLNSQSINNVPSLITKLEQLSILHLDMQNESQIVSRYIIEAFQKYNYIIDSLTRIFVQFEEAVTHLEIDMIQQPVIE